MKKLDIAALKYACQGQWPSILSALGGLKDAANTYGSTKHVDCPFPERHGDSEGRKKFRLYQGTGDYQGGAICTCGSWSDGFDLLQDVNGWTFIETVKAVNDYVNDPLSLDQVVANPRPRQAVHIDEASLEVEREKKRSAQRKKDRFRWDAIRRTWSESVPVIDPAAEPLRRYLAKRRIPPAILEKLSGSELRFHPALDYITSDGEVWGQFPAMIAAVRDSKGKACTLHRTYLSNDGGKAALPDGEEAKKLMAYPSTMSISGGAIRLFEPRPLMGLTEGIETALSVRAATGIPVWPTYSASMLKNFDLKQFNDVKLLLLWADKDASKTGERVANALKVKAWEAGIRCQVLLPNREVEGKGVDWNDVLAEKGWRGFPSEMQILGGE